MTTIRRAAIMAAVFFGFACVPKAVDVIASTPILGAAVAVLALPISAVVFWLAMTSER